MRNFLQVLQVENIDSIAEKRISDKYHTLALRTRKCFFFAQITVQWSISTTAIKIQFHCYRTIKYWRFYFLLELKKMTRNVEQGTIVYLMAHKETAITIKNFQYWHFCNVWCPYLLVYNQIYYNIERTEPHLFRHYHSSANKLSMKIPHGCDNPSKCLHIECH